MNVVSRAGLMSLGRLHPETATVLERFYRITRKVTWHGIHDVRRYFPSADQVGNVIIFDILGGNYRLIVAVNYRTQRMYPKALLTHKEYDRKDWLKWA